MSDEESAVASWLDSPGAKRELEILRERFPHWPDSAAHIFAALCDIRDALDFYGTGTPEDNTDDFDPDDVDEEPWK